MLNKILLLCYEGYISVENKFWKEKNLILLLKLKKIAWYPSQRWGSVFQTVTYLFFKRVR